jgi:hypothetical protein
VGIEPSAKEDGMPRDKDYTKGLISLRMEMKKFLHKKEREILIITDARIVC